MTDLQQRLTGGVATPEGIGVAMVGLPHSNAMGMRLVSTENGEAVLMLPYSKDLVGDVATGVLGGGAITALLDTCCGTAVFVSKSAKITSTATLDLRIDYMRPATPGKDVYAHAECYRVTRSIAFVRALAWTETRDKPVATASAAFIVERTPQKGEEKSA